jgi:16S rRNA (adenine1518-N6/adenine1519-N6)-dimethyltransferase
MLKKSFGQHFLKDDSICEKIVEAAKIEHDDFVVEIGPGAGALTRFIIKRIAFRSDRVALVEADKDLIPKLESEFPDAQIIQSDAAQVDFDGITKDRSWIFLGNLPYNAASAIIVNALASNNPPQKCIFMVQKEQADRMLANPGDMGLLSVVIQLYAKGRRLFNVKPGSFIPPPKVMSSVVELEGGVFSEFSKDQKEQIITFAKAGFSSRRKQLHKNLEAAGIADSDTVKTALESVNKSSTARAQELSIQDWITLFKLLSK